MALINPNHETAAEDPKKFWEDQYQNAKTNLFELDKAIYALTREERKSYSFNSGQNNITVSRQDLPSLIASQEKLRKEVEYLEEKLGIAALNEKPPMFQGVPGW